MFFSEIDFIWILFFKEADESDPPTDNGWEYNISSIDRFMSSDEDDLECSIVSKVTFNNNYF